MRILSFSSVTLEEGAVVAIGNFDGVHLGHQAVLARLIELGKQHNLPTAVILFEPQPLEYFKKNKSPPRIMNFRQKSEIIRDLGIDKVICLAFNQTLAELSPQDFCKLILKQKINTKYVLIGKDFCFGRNREGNIETLINLGDILNFKVEVQQTVALASCDKVSSSAIRSELQLANFSLAQKMLGRSYIITGKVMHGAKRGRLINVPTANIRLNHLPLMLRGVYGVEVMFFAQGSRKCPGVANIGFRPTIDGTSPQLEVHLFDMDLDLYGKRLKVIFKFKIRDEIKFDSFELLTNQIKQDIDVARARLIQPKALI